MDLKKKKQSCSSFMTELQCLQDKGYYRLCIETTINVSYISVSLVSINFRAKFFSRDTSKEKKNQLFNSE